MTVHPTAGAQGRRDALMGWALALVFVVLLVNILMLPRTALDQRATLRLVHDSLGLVLAVLAAIRLWWFVRDPAPRPPPGLPAASFAFNRAILVALCLVFAVTGAIGFFYAWGEGRDVVLFGVELPALVQKSETVRIPMGYLHSTLGFYYIMLFCIWLAFGLYQHLRYRTGLLRLLPGSRV
jgi:cytochrome b561